MDINQSKQQANDIKTETNNGSNGDEFDATQKKTINYVL